MSIMRKIVFIWMTLCLSVVALACGGNDPEVEASQVLLNNLVVAMVVVLRH